MTEQSSKSTIGLDFHPAPFIDSMIDAQRQALEYAIELSEVWAVRAKSESELATTLFGKLAGARSIPDAASAWQECIQRQLQLNTEDARRLIEQNQRFFRAGQEILSSSRALS